MVSLFELIRISLGTQEELSGAPSEEQWALLFNESQRQSVTGIMVMGIEKLPKEQQPPKEILLNWIGLVHLIEQHSKLNEDRTRELTTIFDNHRYNTFILKGVGVAQYYPRPYYRQLGDIDIWVDGDRDEVMRWLRSEYVVHKPVWHNVAVDFFSDIPVEVHFHPSWSFNPYYNNILQKYLESQKVSLGGINKRYGFNVPPIGFQAIACLSHTYRHLIVEGIGLRHIIDIFYILKALQMQATSVLRSDVLRIIRATGMMKILGAMMWVLQEVCGMPSEYVLCEPNEKEGRFLLDEIMRGGNFGHHRKDNRRRNTATRMLALLPHYPKEVLWVVPWKLWHKCWRVINA